MECALRAIGVVFDNKIWVMGGWNDIRNLNDVWYSPDGVSWVCADSKAEWLPRAAHTSLVYDNRVWVMGGDSTGNSLAMSDVWYSSGLGIEETPNAELRTMSGGATVMRRLPTGAVVFDAMGRRTANPKPGVYFVRERRSRGQGVEGSSVRKVVMTR